VTLSTYRCYTNNCIYLSIYPTTGQEMTGSILTNNTVYQAHCITILDARTCIAQGDSR